MMAMPLFLQSLAFSNISLSHSSRCTVLHLNASYFKTIKINASSKK